MIMGRPAKTITDKKISHLGKQFLSVLLLISTCYLVFIAGYLTGQHNKLDGQRAQLVNTETKKPENVDFSLYWEAWNKLQQKSAVDPDARKLVEGSIAGMVASLNDPYTVFMEEDVNKRFRDDIAGEFGGIGIEIVQKNDLPTIVTPLSESPAEKAGLKANDIILEVDGVKTTDLHFNEVVNKIRGEKGTKVNLKVNREGNKDPLAFEVVRDIITVKSVDWEYKNVDGKKILYIKMRQFGEDTIKHFAKMAAEAGKNKPDAILVDVRNNPGGYVETAVDVASYFLDGGVVFSQKEKEDKAKEYRTSHKASLNGIRLAILVNKGSASASEILSGAVQDRGVGKIIGEKTFGKGSVQELVDLSNGSAIKVTIAKWFTPNGRQINEKGIDPDIVVSQDEKSDNDEQLDRALEYLVKGE